MKSCTLGQISMKCLEENGYDKAKCMQAFNNYNVCKQFWNEVSTS